MTDNGQTAELHMGSGTWPAEPVEPAEAGSAALQLVLWAFVNGS